MITQSKGIMEVLGLQNCDPELLNLLRIFENKFIVSDIEPLYYQGVINGSEFETYTATKLYLQLKVVFSYSGATLADTTSGIVFYDESNAICFTLRNKTLAAYYNAAEFLRSDLNSYYFTNSYFSRIARTTYDYIIFNGFRVTIQLT
jgi:hypothetical protein